MIKGLYKFAEKWSLGGSVWFISDTHFDDPDRELMGYAISNQEHHDLIKKTVGKNDTLIHLGDVGNTEYFRDIKGYKVLILGNHDFTATKYKPYFDEIYEGPLTISRKIILSHEPVDVPWAFNLHGHDHSGNLYGEHHYNFAANVCGYAPISLSKMIKSGIISNIQDIHRLTIDKATEKKNGRVIF
jgi:calcineurin-like phosphoesterase family protein